MKTYAKWEMAGNQSPMGRFEVMGLGRSPRAEAMLLSMRRMRDLVDTSLLASGKAHAEARPHRRSRDCRRGRRSCCQGLCRKVRRQQVFVTTRFYQLARK